MDVCDKITFDKFEYVFEKKSIEYVVDIFTLLLAHFASKLVNYSRHGRISKSTTFSIATICLFPKIFQILTVPRMIDQFGRKRCQQKRKDVATNFWKNFFKNILLYMNGRPSKFCSVHTDGLFWLNLYGGRGQGILKKTSGEKRL